MAGTKILLVDDSKTMRLSVRKMISDLNAGYVILDAADGVEGIEVLKANQDTKLAILDYNLPVMNGLELSAAIKSNPLLKDVYIVVLTSIGHENEKLMKVARDIGVIAWLTKPLKEKQLRMLLEKLML